MSGRVIPIPDEGSAPFWAAAAEHRLTLPRCARCGQFSWPPDITCPHCRSTEPGFRFEPVAPTGTVRTWTVIRQSFLPGMAVPFVLVDVALDAVPDIRIIGQLLDGPEAALAVGDPVEARFEDLAPGIALPAFAKVGR